MLDVLAEDVATGAVGRLIAAPIRVEDVATRPIDISDIPAKSDSELF
jgi:hypothetical protein